ncbi:sulfotransferase [Frankia sp. AgB1.9]|nr:sulfotransferase [Frankia sp. AgW1.1]MBL7551108.1 sulfotransferase [Frankia sp. AgB1.9]MBL7624726.1 sulfotransferase [Frankia sp. AgB1.8]
MVSSAESLVVRAHESCGLTDLGPGGWRNGLDNLVTATERDASGDPEAVERIEALLVQRLVTRMRIEEWYSEHAREAADPIDGPLMIVGLPRTATTAMHFLLANDPRFRYLRPWEVNNPVPPPVLGRERDDPRRPRVPPAANPRHIVAVDGPAEDWPIHALAFDHAELTLPVPSHATWWRGTSHTDLFPYQERVLRLLHAHRPPHRWLLKTPAYVFLLPEAAAHYPDARFVFTHRDPVAALASTCSTVADARRQRTPSWSPDDAFGPSLLEHWSVGVQQAMAARETIGQDRFLDVGQYEIESDPVGTAERIYEFTRLTLDDEVRLSMRRWAEANSQGARPAHRYSLEEYGLTAAGITDAFAPYLERFASHCFR